MVINIVTWLSDEGRNEELAAFCAGEDIRIAADSFQGTEDFLEKFSNLDVNVDVVVLNDKILGEGDKKTFFENIRAIEPNVRVIVIFPGYRNQYVEDQIKEYKERYGVSDIIFEGRSLDLDSFAEVIKKGYIFDYDMNVFDDQELSRPVSRKKRPCVTVGVMGLTRGCGVTNMAVSAATYIALTENLPVRVVDFTETGNLRFATKAKGVTYIVSRDVDVARLKNASRVVVFDFGAPYNISPKGRLLSTAGSFNDKRMELMRSCDLKIFMGLADPWHRDKLKFLLRDGKWKHSLEDGCLFLFDSVNDELRARYPHVRLNGRGDKSVSSAVRALFSSGKGGD